MDLPKVKGLNPQQQARLDGELVARKLTTFKAQRARPMELVAALQVAFEVDAQSVLIAYGDEEARAKEMLTNVESVRAVNAEIARLAVQEQDEVKPRTTRRSVRPSLEE